MSGHCDRRILNTLAFCLALFVIDVRLGVIAIIGILVYLAVTECSTATTAKQALEDSRRRKDW